MSDNVKVTVADSNPVNVTIQAMAGNAVLWGKINGTLSNQADLQAALDDKYTKAEVDASFFKLDAPIVGYSADNFFYNGDNQHHFSVLPLQYDWTVSTKRGPNGNATPANPTGFAEPTLIKQNGMFYIFYEYNTGQSPQDWKIGLAHSTTLAGPWTIVEPLLEGSGNVGDPDELGVADPTVLYVPWSEYKWHMWFDMYDGTIAGWRIGHAYANSPTGPWIKQDLDSSGVTDVVLGDDITSFDGYNNYEPAHCPEAFISGGCVHLLYGVRGAGHTDYDTMLAIANDSQGLGFSFKVWGPVTHDNTTSWGESYRLRGVFKYENFLYGCIADLNTGGDTKHAFVVSSDAGKSWQMVGEAPQRLNGFVMEGKKLYAIGPSSHSDYFYELDLENLSGSVSVADVVIDQNISIPLIHNVKKGYYLDGENLKDNYFDTTDGHQLRLTSQRIDDNEFEGTVTGTFALFANAQERIATLDFGYDSYSTNALARIAGDMDGYGSWLKFGTSNNYANGITNTAMVIDPTGKIGLNNQNPTAQCDLVISNSTSVGMRIKGALSQSGNYQEWVDDSENIVVSIIPGTNTKLMIHSNDFSAPNDYIEIYHDKTVGTIYTPEWLRLRSGGEVQLYAGSKEIRYKDGTGSTMFGFLGGTSESKMFASDSYGNSLVFTSLAARTSNHDHGVQANPTFFIHSDLNPAVSNNQWGSFSHDENDFVIQTGDLTGVGSSPTTITNDLRIHPGTKHDGYVIKKSAELQTTDAVQTVLKSILLEDNNTYHIEAFIVGVKSDGTDTASYHLSCTAYRTGGGNAIILGQTTIHSVESNASWDAVFTINGSNLRVSVTGVASTTIEWGCTITLINMSN